jgi:hypothetical protein
MSRLHFAHGEYPACGDGRVALTAKTPQEVNCIPCLRKLRQSPWSYRIAVDGGASFPCPACPGSFWRTGAYLTSGRCVIIPCPSCGRPEAYDEAAHEVWLQRCQEKYEHTRRS